MKIINFNFIVGRYNGRMMTLFKGLQLSAASVRDIYAIKLRISLTVSVFTIESLKFIQKLFESSRHKFSRNRHGP